MIKDLSVVIPAYNEEKTIAQVIDKVLTIPRVGEVIVVNDASKDKTLKKLEPYNDKIRIINNEVNRGKGYSLRKGIEAARCKYMIVQDADLELNPDCFELLFHKMERTNADVVNAIRDFSSENINLISKLASKMIPFLVFIFYQKWINDVVCGYKLMETEKYRKLNLNTDRFEIETEIIVLSIKLKYKIVEEKIPYKPRSRAEGKHVNWIDGWRVLKFLIKEKF